MRAVYAETINPDDPMAGLRLGDLAPATPDNWVTVEVRASSLNHHDLWSLRGVGLGAEQLPMILGCDAAGVDPDGNEVVVHSVIAGSQSGDADETMDPKRTLLSEKYPGTLAERVAVPAGNLVPKPAELSFAEAACLPTAWLTAYRMLRTRGRLPEGGSVLVQGAGGGVATAAVVLGTALGARVYATSRDAGKRERIAALGATALEPGARLPERVDVVIETVGEATWGHSMKSLNQGGRIVVAGAHTGAAPSADLNRLFYREIAVFGSAMGTLDEFKTLCAFVEHADLHPPLSEVYDGVEKVRDAMRIMDAGEQFGKLVIRP